jgi:folate-binding protein YgfZ
MFDAARELCRLARGKAVVAPWDGAPRLGAVLATGPEVASFLQAQLTSDVLALEPGDLQLSARLDRKGNLVCWFHLLRMPERGQPFPSYLMTMPRSLTDALVEDLQAYVFSENLLLENATAEFQGLLVQGPATEHLLSGAAGLELPLGVLRWPLSLTGDPGALLLVPGDNGTPLFEGALAELQAQGCGVLGDDEASAQAWHWLQVEAGWPSLEHDLKPGARVLPQTGLEQQAVSYTKGCYLGQEVVARIRTYGAVPQALRGLIFNGYGLSDLDAAPAPGEPLLDAQGKKIGTWARAAWSDTLDEPVALVFLDRVNRTPGHTLEVQVGADETLPAQVALLPLYSAANTTEKAAALHHRAVEAFSQGRDEEAISLLEECLRLDPSHSEAYEALGVILGRGERYHEAIDIFRRLEEVAPEEPMVHTNLSLYYMKVGDKEEAERQKALGTMKRFGNTDPAAVDAMEAAERQGRREEAARKQIIFAEVLEIDPDDPLALMGMGNALIDLDQPEVADDYLARALVAQKDNSALYLSRGKLLQQLGRQDEAAEVLQRGIEVASRRGDLMPLREMEHRLALGVQSPER